MSAPPPPPVPADGNQDRGPAVVSIYWVQTAVAVVVVASRFFARRIIRSTGADDWLMLITLLLFIVISCLVTYQSSLGGFRHLYFVNPTNLLEVGKINYIFQVFGIFSYATGKASVGCLILRILGPQTFWRKWIIWATIILTFVLNSLNCILTFVQCDPPRALWDKSITDAHCWDPTVQPNFAIFVASENILADVILALLPATFLWKLNMTFKNRVTLCTLLGLGLFAAVCGIVKTTFLSELASHADITWETYNVVVWSGAEDFVIIVCGSVPPLKTIYDRYVAKTRVSKSSKYEYSATSSSGLKRPYLKHTGGSSVSSQNNGLVQEIGKAPKNSIRAVTDVEVVNHRDDSKV